jgi:4-hydroxy-2-oxovalerate aldolase
MRAQLAAGSQQVLDVTLRDGSYLVDFQFTAEDTARIAAALESVGIRRIEVGHGLGLRASEAGKGQAAATDVEYMEACVESLKHASWGMFCIPGIARLDDLRIAAEHKMHFVRVGANITEADSARPFLELAKKLELTTSYNAMKSYVVAPTEFARIAALAHSWGADLVCLVDSAGGMYPDDVRQYLRAAHNASDVLLAFHGHDNLSLAMANTLSAIESGASLVDSSLQGMGRSAGNAVTEVLVAILKQRGHMPEVDLKGIMDVGQALVAPLMRNRGMDPLALTAGYARFHSSFTEKVQRYANKHHLDVRDLIVRLCQEDLVQAPDDLLDQLGQELASSRTQRITSIPLPEMAARTQRESTFDLQTLLKEIRPLARKTNRYSALNVVTGEKPLSGMLVSSNIQSTNTHVIGSVTVTSDEQLETVLGSADGRVDIVFLDVDRKPFAPSTPAQTARSTLHKSLLLTYLDSRVWVDAVEDQLVRLLGEVLDGATVVIRGNHPKSRFLALRLAERHAIVALVTDAGCSVSASVPDALRSFSFDPAHLDVTLLEASSTEVADWVAQARAVVVWSAGLPTFGQCEARHLEADAYVLDAGIGSILPEGLEEARRRKALLVRVNIWPVLLSALAAAHDSSCVYRDAFGWSTLGGVPITAAGAMGAAGDVVVDNVHEPTRVIGVADGRGGVSFRYAPEHLQRVRSVLGEVNRRLICPKLGEAAR